MDAKRILVVFGTRPCFIVKICVTGQHKEMLTQVLDIFDVKPDYDLNVMENGQGLTETMAKIQNRIITVLDKKKPCITLVHGDILIVMAVSMTCFFEHYRVGHVEAGLHTYNMQESFPEEFNRRVISLIASYHFAPTQSARNKQEESIFIF